MSRKVQPRLETCLLHTWPYGSVTHFSFEISTLHCRISSFYSADSTLKYTTILYFYYHLNRLHHSLSYNPSSNIKEQHIYQHRVRFFNHIEQ